MASENERVERAKAVTKELDQARADKAKLEETRGALIKKLSRHIAKGAKAAQLAQITKQIVEAEKTLKWFGKYISSLKEKLNDLPALGPDEVYSIEKISNNNTGVQDHVH